jgi:hypothetical protein
LTDAEVITPAPVAAFNFGGNVECSRSLLQEAGIMPITEAAHAQSVKAASVIFELHFIDA